MLVVHALTRLVTCDRKKLHMPVVVLHRGPGDLANRLCEDGVAVRTYSGRNEEGYVGLCSDPAPVVSNEGILVFHEDKDNHGDLWVTSRSGGLGAIYSEDTRIDTEVMTGSPGAVAVDNAVYVFYQQHAKYGYWLAGRRFIGPASTTSGGFASTGITGSPRAVVFSGWTYIFHRGRTDGYGNEHQLFFNRARGFDVEGEQAVPSVRASNNPAPSYSTTTSTCSIRTRMNSATYVWRFFTRGSGDTNASHRG